MAAAKGSQKSPRCGPVCQGQCQTRSEKCSGPVLMSPSFRLDRTISLPCDFISLNKITTLILNIFSVDSKLPLGRRPGPCNLAVYLHLFDRQLVASFQVPIDPGRPKAALQNCSGVVVSEGFRYLEFLPIHPA